MPPLFEQIIGQHECILHGLGHILQRTDASPPHAVVLLPYLLLLGLPPPPLPPAVAITPRLLRIAIATLLSRVGSPPKIRPQFTQSSLHIADFLRIF